MFHELGDAWSHHAQNVLRPRLLWPSGVRLDASAGKKKRLIHLSVIKNDAHADRFIRPSLVKMLIPGWHGWASLSDPLPLELARSSQKWLVRIADVRPITRRV
jgi:hypothetical protein